MEKLLRYSRTVRRNWKKSAVAFLGLSWGADKVYEKYQIHLLMQAACIEAAKYGEVVIPMERNPTVVTVILNPVANKRSAKKDFEAYCEPLLHLAGLQVDVVQTAAEGNAKEIVETLRGTEAIIVAGGDGTLSETITGLLRRSDDANQFPLGILPLGRTNTLGNSMFPGGTGVEKVRQLIDASMAIIKGKTEWKDAVKIEPITDDGISKPIYAMSAIEWGAFRDTMAKKDKYWFTGPLREYAAFVFNGYKDSLTWNCSGTIRYTPPCPGCSNCLQHKPEIKRKWSFFIPVGPSIPQTIQADASKNLNPACIKTDELSFKTCDFKIITSNVRKCHEFPSVGIVLGKNTYSYTEFVSEGWDRVNNKAQEGKVIPVRTVELIPKETEKEVNIEIDKEEFELKPVKITVLPKVVKFYCRKQ